MSEKHYNINYLEGTALVLKSLKENSYKPFQHIKEGRILDLGCGTGIDAINLATVLGPNVSVTGIDHDAAMIEKARASAKDVQNIEFRVAEVYPIAQQDSSAQGARAERLLQHLKEPAELIKDVYRVLEPEAPFVIVETDWSSLTFYNNDPVVAKKVSAYLTDQKVNNGAVARELTYGLKTAGFRDISFEVFPFVVKTVQEIFAYLLIDQSLQEMREKGLLTPGEYELFMEDLLSAEAGTYFACTLNLVIASAVK